MTTTFTGGQDYGYKRRHYEVAFDVDNSTNQNPKVRTPTHVAMKIMKNVGDVAHSFSKMWNSNTGKKHPKKLEWSASDNSPDATFRKQEIYKGIARRIGVKKIQKAGFTGNRISLGENKPTA